MRLSEKVKIFSRVFIAFSQFALNFEYFEKKKELHSPSISDAIDSQRRVYFNAWKVLILKTLRQ